MLLISPVKFIALQWRNQEYHSYRETEIALDFMSGMCPGGNPAANGTQSTHDAVETVSYIHSYIWRTFNLPPATLVSLQELLQSRPTRRKRRAPSDNNPPVQVVQQHHQPPPSPVDETNIMDNLELELGHLPLLTLRKCRKYFKLQVWWCLCWSFWFFVIMHVRMKIIYFLYRAFHCL